MNKTLYIRDEDEPIWDRARELTDEKKLSPVIVDALRKFIAEKESENRGFQKLLVSFRDATDSELPKAKAFFGKWIISPVEGFKATSMNRFVEAREERYFAVAITAKNQIAVHHWKMTKNGARCSELFDVFSSFSEAAADDEVCEAVRVAYERLGVPVEELDI